MTPSRTRSAAERIRPLEAATAAAVPREVVKNCRRPVLVIGMVPSASA
jgi:hypothetical protein